MQRVHRLALAALLMCAASTVVQAQSGSSLSSPSSSSSSSLGQSGAPKSGEPARRYGDRWNPNRGQLEPQRLFVVIEANVGKKANDIQQIVRLGLEYLRKEGKCEFEHIKVLPVSSTLYKGMKALFKGDDLETADMGENHSTVRLVPGGRAVWEVGTGSPFARAKSITVFFERDEDSKVITLSPPLTYPTAPVNEVDQPFRFHSPGTYVFALEGEMLPTRYEIELIPEPGEDKKPSVVKADWPQENLYYLLLVDQFVGDRKLLFETLKNNRVVGNGLKDVETVESATISLATFIDSIDMGTSSWDDERHYHVRVKKPDDKFPKRIWLKFPLNAAAVKEELEILKTQCALGAEDRQLLLETIRTECVLATDEVVLNPESEAAWYEILPESKDMAGYSRVFEVEPGENPAAPVEMAFGLAIFEFNDEMMLSVGNNFVMQLEHPRWTEGVHKMMNAAAAAAAGNKENKENKEESQKQKPQ